MPYAYAQTFAKLHLVKKLLIVFIFLFKTRISTIFQCYFVLKLSGNLEAF